MDGEYDAHDVGMAFLARVGLALLSVWRWVGVAPMRLLVENFEVFETVVFFETVRMVDCMGWGWEEGCKMPCGIKASCRWKYVELGNERHLEGTLSKLVFGFFLWNFGQGQAGSKAFAGLARNCMAPSGGRDCTSTSDAICDGVGHQKICWWLRVSFAIGRNESTTCGVVRLQDSCWLLKVQLNYW